MELSCYHCGRAFTAKPAPRAKHRFCGLACLGLWRRNQPLRPDSTTSEAGPEDPESGRADRGVRVSVYDGYPPYPASAMPAPRIPTGTRLQRARNWVAEAEARMDRALDRRLQVFHGMHEKLNAETYLARAREELAAAECEARVARPTRTGAAS
jgi:hypothetical protein